MSEPNWEDFRRRARRRSAAVMALILGPVVLVVPAANILRSHDYPVGDVRNEPTFWLLLGLVFLVVVGGAMAWSIRELRR